MLFRSHGRPKGSKNKTKLPAIRFRHEIEQAYIRMGGINGLLEWCQSDAGKKEFYPLVLKIMATFELKETRSEDEIHVVVYKPESKAAQVLESQAVPIPCQSAGITDVQTLNTETEAGALSAGGGPL